MKKSYLFLAATAILALASCSENTYLGENEENAKGTSGAISFGNGFKAVTRAGEITGADAADLLGEKFIVGGFKNGNVANGIAGTGVTTVFDNYVVKWEQNTAAKTESNTSDWEYVGLDIIPLSSLYISDTDPNYPAKQTIKYWDFSAAQYDYLAFSVGKGNTLVEKTDITDGTPTSGYVFATSITASTATTAAYKLRGLKEDLLECYITDLKSITNTDYAKEVQLDFRRLASKVRIALYETIPGYSITNVKFYDADNGATSSETATLFVSGTSTNVFNNNGTYTISYPTIGSENTSNPDHNKAHVSFTAEASDGTGTTETFGSIDYTGGKERKEATGGTNFLGRTSTAPSFAKTTNVDYHYVLPNETGAVVELRVDYTLVPIDGASETITVYGAKAFIPAAYTQWKSNFAYTYIFKISDNTNGLTNPSITDKPGLYPITFDAVITEAEDYNQQSTITTVAMPSITTYQKGHNYSTDGPEYKTSDRDSIYVQVMKSDGSLANDLNTNGKLYTVDGAGLADLTEAEVMDALNIRTSGDATTIVGRNGFTLTPATEQLATDYRSDGDNDATFSNIPGADGNGIPVAKNTATRFVASANTYAYVYYTGTDNADTYYNSAVIFASEPSNWDTTYSNYYTDEACETPATSTYDPSITYYQKYTNLNKVYGVKVIRVVAAP